MKAIIIISFLYLFINVDIACAEKNFLILSASGSGYTHETKIRFRQGATENFDWQHDAYHLKSLDPLAPNFSSLSEDLTDLSVNSFPALTQDFSIFIRLTVAVTDNFTIAIKDMSTMLSNSRIILEDIVTGSFTNFRVDSAYTFTITDTAISPRFLIHVSVPLLLKSTITNVGCEVANNGSIDLTVSGGETPYKFKWSNGETTEDIFNLDKGTYIVTVSDFKGVMTNKEFIITVSDPIITNISLIQEPTCNGKCDGEATVNVSGGTPPFTYQWHDPMTQIGTTATNLCAGTYYAVVLDKNNCISVASITIDESSTLSTTITANNTIQGSCNGNAMAVVDGGILGYIYQWDDPKSQTTQTAIELCEGTYNVTISDAIGCSTTSSVEINEVLETGIGRKDVTIHFNIYPNPTYGEITIELQSEEMQNAEIRIVNVLGQEVYSEKLNKISTDGHKQVNLYGYEKGVYIVDILKDNQSKFRKKISLL